MERSKICAELMFILEQVPHSYSKSIPEKVKENIKNEMSSEHYNKLNKDKIFYNQSISEETLRMLFDIYEKYWKE